MSKYFPDPKKYLLFGSLFLLTAVVSHAQTITPAVVNSTGGTKTQGTVIYEWSIGEMALVESMISSKLAVTNGVLQAEFLKQAVVTSNLVKPNNLLTPNGDGKNDTWIIKDIENYPDNEVMVFDRAGRVVFQAKNYQNTWTGNIPSGSLSEDTYYYVLTIRVDGKANILKGFITLIN